MRVLLATDGSIEAAMAMRTASRLLTRTGREMFVLHVAREHRLPKPSYQDRQAAETRHILQYAKQVLGEEGVDAPALCQTGSPARVIMRESEGYEIGRAHV